MKTYLVIGLVVLAVFILVVTIIIYMSGGDTTTVVGGMGTAAAAAAAAAEAKRRQVQTQVVDTRTGLAEAQNEIKDSKAQVDAARGAVAGEVAALDRDAKEQEGENRWGTPRGGDA